jgi:hypothetical protein
MGGEVTRLRILGVVWVIAGLIVGFFGLTMLGLAEDLVGAAAGAVVLVLAGLALPVGPARCGVSIRPDTSDGVSLAVSVLWLVASIFTTWAMDFPADRWLAGGVPAAIGALTAVLALPAWRPGSPGRPGTLGATETEEPPQ